MRLLVQICRIIVGVLFIISGFVKAVDPVGFAFKLEEYFAPDVLNLSFLNDLALPMATTFSILEIVLGILLLLGIARKFTMWAILLLILFFSFLTFYSAYFNKVTDCGCFGEALHLEPWQSFYKDLFLLVLILILIAGQKYIQPIFKQKAISHGTATVLTLIMAWVSYTGIKNLPLIDFRAYAVGKNIQEGMKSAEELGLTPPQYQVLYTMNNEETGETLVITDDDYMSDSKWYEQGTPWKMDADKTVTKKISSGYEAPIHDFLLDCDGEDMTDAYLEEPKMVFFINAFAEKVSADDLAHLNKLYADLTAKGIKVVDLTAGDLPNAEFPVCFVDQTTLKTITRNNPGVVALKKGTVTAKFHNNPLPTAEEVMKVFD